MLKVCFNPFTKFETINNRHHYITNNKLNILGLYFIKRFLAIHGPYNGILLYKLILKKIQYLRIIVDQKYQGFHKVNIFCSVYSARVFIIVRCIMKIELFLLV